MLPVTLACQAMATRFEIVLAGHDPVRLRAAGEEALHEIGRLEAQLSLYRPESEIAEVNARAAREPVRVSPRVFALLQQAERLSRESNGAFDITIAALVRCWGFRDGQGTMPDPGDLARAREQTGMHLVHLNPEDGTVHFLREGVMLDLGAIGKGYAVDRAVEILREAGVTSALIHGGTSTVYALGRPPEAEFWKVAIAKPPHEPAHEPERRSPTRRHADWGDSPCAGSETGAPSAGFMVTMNDSEFVEAHPKTCATVPLKRRGHVRLGRVGQVVSVRRQDRSATCSIRAAASRSKERCWPPWCCRRPPTPTRCPPPCWCWDRTGTRGSPRCVPGVRTCLLRESGAGPGDVALPWKRAQSAPPSAQEAH